MRTLSLRFLNKYLKNETFLQEVVNHGADYLIAQ